MIVAVSRSLRSSPGPKTGCSTSSCASLDLDVPVAILTRSEDRVQPVHARRDVIRTLMLRSSPGPKTGCSSDVWRCRAGDSTSVAILTRSEDRVQRCAVGRWRSARRRLRSSPGPKTGCSGQDLVGGPHARRGCDPHPVRRPGAAPPSGAPSTAAALRCDPHPVRRPGAARRAATRSRGDPGVAILTRSEDRVQPVGDPRPDRGDRVAILTRSEDRVQRAVESPGRADPGCCDPHPVRRPGAACDTLWCSSQLVMLRSSPGPKTGCSCWSRPRPRSSRTGCDPHPVRRPGAAGVLLGAHGLLQVAILTRSEDRVQR